MPICELHRKRSVANASPDSECVFNLVMSELVKLEVFQTHFLSHAKNYFTSGFKTKGFFYKDSTLWQDGSPPPTSVIFLTNSQLNQFNGYV